MIDTAKARECFERGRFFGNMAQKPMFRTWLCKRDNVSDDCLHEHIVEKYVKTNDNGMTAMRLVEEFKRTHS